MADTGRELADLAAELVTYPQVLLNVRVREKVDLQTVPAVADGDRSASSSGSPARAGCWCATRAPSRCCAS